MSSASGAGFEPSTLGSWVDCSTFVLALKQNTLKCLNNLWNTKITVFSVKRLNNI